MWWLSVILFINFPNSKTHRHPHVHPAIIPDPLPHPSAMLNEELSLWWGLCAYHVALFYIISDLSKTSGSRYCYPQFRDETIAIREMIAPEITGHVSNYGQVQTHTCLGSCVCFSHHITTLVEFPWLISHLPLTHSPELNKVIGFKHRIDHIATLSKYSWMASAKFRIKCAAPVWKTGSFLIVPKLLSQAFPGCYSLPSTDPQHSRLFQDCTYFLSILFFFSL